MKLEEVGTFDINFVDSAASERMKIGSGTGESRLYLGNTAKYREIYDFFSGDVRFYFFCKRDLQRYLCLAEEEYLNPTQNYRHKTEFTLYYKENKSLVATMEDYLPCSFCETSDSDRCFIRLNGNVNNSFSNYEFLRKICIPKYTKFVFRKFVDKDTKNSYINIMPLFNKPYSVEKLGKILAKRYEESNPKEVGIVLFGFDYAQLIIDKKYQVSDIVKAAGIEEAYKTELELALKTYSSLKESGLGINGLETIILDRDESGSTRPILGALHEDSPLQQIWYGAPGTGKSHEIKEQTAGKAMVRTTFHPDSDYSTFVGAYKPVMDEVDVKVTPVVTTGGVSFSPASDMKEKRISYRFVKQAFMKAYLGAWKKYANNPQSPEPQYLVIEEINRGNCAQIFGDIFQLLDRSGNGFSEYPIEADEDLRQEIARSFAEEDDYKLSDALAVNGVVEDYTSNYGATLSEDIQEGRVMLLPSNLYIWATMNTSDQSLFPIDSAFKRRWEWKYMPIKEGIDKVTGKKLDYKIVLGNGKEYDWFEFITEMNKLIAEKTTSEDKQMGYFFIKAEDKKITADRFVNKVLFYLYNDVFKSYEIPTDVFGNKKFTDFFDKMDTKVEELMKDLGLKALGENSPAAPTEAKAEDSTEGTAK